MKELFRGFYKPTDEQFKELWSGALFVLDANVLLNLYRYPSSAREALFRVMEEISSRIWVPHQAAWEYQRNRLAVIAKQKSIYKELKDHINSSRKNLVNGINDLQLSKRHSAIDAVGFLRDIENSFDEFIIKLEELEKNQPDVHEEDEIRNRIEQLLIGKVGQAPEKEWLETVCKEGKERYGVRKPPGFGDLPKEREPSSIRHYGSLSYSAEYGDLIIWKQIIQEAGKENIKQLIFVTDDRKDDWWHVIDSGGKKTIGPRAELAEEIYVEGKVERFWMYTADKFLGYARQYLEVEIEDLSIEEAKETMYATKSTGGAIFIKSPIGELTDVSEPTYENDLAALKILVDMGIVEEMVSQYDAKQGVSRKLRSKVRAIVALSNLTTKGIIGASDYLDRDTDEAYKTFVLTEKGMEYIFKNVDRFDDTDEPF